MATYASTLIIKGKLNCSESNLIKKLNLDVPRRNSDNYKIGTANTSYNNALSCFERGDVYVAYYKEFTVIVSLSLVADFMSNGLLLNSTQTLFPTNEMFLFFNNTTSNLSGFVYMKDKVIVRRKCVIGGKIELNDGDLLDEGELLKEEILAYKRSVNDINQIKNSKEYLVGFHDFNISIDFLENQFFYENPIPIFDSMVLNAGFEKSILAEYLKQVNKKVEIKEIDELVLNSIKSIIKANKFKRSKTIKKREQVKRVFKKELKENISLLLSLEIKQTFGRFHCDISIGLFDEKIINNLPKGVHLSHVSDESGVPIYNVSSKDLLENKKNQYGIIYNWGDFEQYVQTLPKQIEQIEKFISGIQNVDSLSNLLKDENVFTELLDKLANRYKNGERKRIVNFREFNYFLIHLSLNPNNATQAKKLMDFIALDLNFNSMSKKRFIDNVSILIK